MAKELSELILLPLANQAEDHDERIRSLRQQRLRLERELNGELGLAEVLDTPELEEVQISLPDGAVSVDFFVGKFVYAWILKPTGEPQLVPLGGAETLRKAQEDFLRGTAIRGGRTLDTTRANVTTKLLDLLWGPLRDSVGESTQVFICPDGFLCELPFGILRQADGKYLLEKHRFVYLTDPTSIALMAEPSGENEGSLFAVGGVNYFRRDDVPESTSPGLSTRSKVKDTWNSLPATRAEMQSLRDLHEFILEWSSPITVVEGKAATEERIRAELPGKRYVHIATHGYFEPSHLPSLLLDAEEKQAKAQLGEQVQAVGLLPGLLSGLVFAGVNGEADPTRDDGYLSAEEIQHLDLTACDLIVLSACETALGSARAGEGLMSLRRSFTVAGADTVVSSLWKVDDPATAQLMKDFYSNLWEKSMSRGEALHEAKLRMLRRNRIDNAGNALPSTWGAFVLSGNWK
ncbi:MAG: CHAT domain-containing protein [Planctomycetes bacterium]|nr:CHAT domain-containing protein [Planctomycetota bacterium]